MLNATYLASLDDWPGKADVAQGTEYSNALCAGAYFGHVSIVEMLLQDGAAVNMQKECGYALVYASRKGNVEIVQMLLEHGAGVNARGGEHRRVLQQAIYTALRGARYGSHEEVVQLLQKNLLPGNRVDVGLNSERGRPGSPLGETYYTPSLKQRPTLPPIQTMACGESLTATSDLF